MNNDAEFRTFSFTLNKMYELPKVEELVEFLKHNLKDNIEISSTTMIYKNFTITFKIKSDKSKEKADENA